MMSEQRKIKRRSLLRGAMLALAATPAAAEAPGLATLMHNMQTHLHKTQLSVAARNSPLAYFYIHELEETAEYIGANIEEYDGHPVGALAESMLIPALERLESAVKAEDWDASEARFEDALQTCNACHAVTDHAMVRIAPAEGNPFAQDFSVTPD